MAHEIPDFGNAKDEARIQKALSVLKVLEMLEKTGAQIVSGEEIEPLDIDMLIQLASTLGGK